MNLLRPLLVAVGLGVATSLHASPKIGVLLRDRDLFYGAVEQGAQQAGTRLGAEVVVKAPMRANSTAQQLALLASFQKEPFDALVVAPLTAAEFKQPLADLAAKGVKIVLIELPIPGAAYPTVEYDQAEMAATAGREMGALVKDGDEILLMRANSLDGVTVREKTLLTTLKATHPKSAVHSDFMTGLERGDDHPQIVKALAAHPQSKLLCTAFTAASLAGIQVIQEKGLAGKVLHAGFGSGLPAEAVQALEKGALQIWVAQQPKQIGAKAVELALDLVNGKTLPATIPAPYAIVTKANLGSPEIQAIRQ
ncbi:hypothetical protein DB347_15490 [Opitutaceae bacterium EW11]|nr:hypothetical protein DB347_15490 [Opitutaceae bacterium EW11]